jgi:hypothetical protein
MVVPDQHLRDDFLLPMHVSSEPQAYGVPNIDLSLRSVCAS